MELNLHPALRDWLMQAPKCTSFRINKLQKFSVDKLNNLLDLQSKELKSDSIPKLYFLKPDCLVLEPWSLEVSPNGCSEIIVDALCAAAVLRGAHVFAPGVMGLSSHSRVGDKVNVYGDLEGKCKRGLKVAYDGKKIFVGVGCLKMTRKDLFDNGNQPNGIAVHILIPASKLPVVNESLYPKGSILLQNLPSIVCGWVMDPKPYENILDMCSAPGNKTTHLAELSFNKAFISALDKTPQKVLKIKENCEAHGITCVQIFAFDSTQCCSEDNTNCRRISDGPPFPPGSFDKILLDAPCSGLGQRPLLRYKISPKMLASYKFVQRKLFIAAEKVLKDGGTLVYSTCTVTQDENERMVSWVMDKLPTLKLVPALPLLGGPGLANCGLNDEQRVMVQRFGPENDPLREVDSIYKDTIGFFIAKFIKIK